MTVSAGPGKKTIIQRAIAGDPQALSELHRRYDAKFRAFAMKIGGRVSEDRIQAILSRFVELLRQPEEKFNDDFHQKFTAWVYRVTENVLREAWRRGDSRIGPSLDTAADTRPFQDVQAAIRSETPLDELLRNEARRLMLEQVEALPSLYSQVVRLYWFEGMDYAAIGRRLGIPEPAVRKRMQRAYERLRINLKMRGF